PAMTDDPSADLVEMLCAAEPSLDAEWFEGSVKEQHPITLWPNGLQRLLAWANARRDAAVEAKQTDSRDAQIAHEVVEVAARVADPTGWGWYNRSAVDTNKYTQETRGSFHERTTRAMRCALAVAAPLMMDARDAQIARLREALEDISKQKLTEEIDADDARWGDYEGAYNTIIGVARAALRALRRAMADNAREK